MDDYKSEFIEFMVRSGVLTFGDFVTKSGRQTPYFINTGRFDTGRKIDRLGGFYARALSRHLGETFDCLFGPAYKGIPLVVATSAALARDFGRDVGFAFNRKEIKDHGEGGALVGCPLHPGHRVVIVEDVVTAGTSVRQCMPLLRAVGGVQVRALIVAVDRQERGRGEHGALAELRETYGIEAFAIATIDEIVHHLAGRSIDGRVVLDESMQERVAAYRREHGVSA